MSNSIAGNALKFTSKGSVSVICSVEQQGAVLASSSSLPAASETVFLKCTIESVVLFVQLLLLNHNRDTGIGGQFPRRTWAINEICWSGLTQSQIKGLFQPFQQADTSSTRKYGGTGARHDCCQ